MTRGPTDGGSGRERAESTVSHDVTGGETPSEAVVRAVAAVTNTELTEIDPLYGVVDPDALDSIFEGRERRASGLEVSFTFYGCRITVTDDAVRVRSDSGD